MTDENPTPRGGEGEDEQVEDLPVEDEEITDRVRGGRRAISIP